MAKYIVEVVMATCMVVEAEAQELACEKADPFLADDWDYDFNCVYKDDEDEERTPLRGSHPYKKNSEKNFKNLLTNLSPCGIISTSTGEQP